MTLTVSTHLSCMIGWHQKPITAQSLFLFLSRVYLLSSWGIKTTGGADTTPMWLDKRSEAIGWVIALCRLWSFKSLIVRDVCASCFEHVCVCEYMTFLLVLPVIDHMVRGQKKRKKKKVGLTWKIFCLRFHSSFWLLGNIGTLIVRHTKGHMAVFIEIIKRKLSLQHLSKVFWFPWFKEEKKNRARRSFSLMRTCPGFRKEKKNNHVDIQSFLTAARHSRLKSTRFLTHWSEAELPLWGPGKKREEGGRKGRKKQVRKVKKTSFWKTKKKKSRSGSACRSGEGFQRDTEAMQQEVEGL